MIVRTVTIIATLCDEFFSTAWQDRDVLIEKTHLPRGLQSNNNRVSGVQGCLHFIHYSLHFQTQAVNIMTHTYTHLRTYTSVLLYICSPFAVIKFNPKTKWADSRSAYHFCLTGGQKKSCCKYFEQLFLITEDVCGAFKMLNESLMVFGSWVIYVWRPKLSHLK